MQEPDFFDLNDMFSRPVINLRWSRGLTQKQVASYVGVSQAYISMLEQGKRHTVSLAVYSRLKELLEPENRKPKKK